MEIIQKSILGIRWEKTAIGNEFARKFCAGIGPLQLGVVLVSLNFNIRRKSHAALGEYVDYSHHENITANNNRIHDL